jgi:haloalkane dehalogenase
MTDMEFVRTPDERFSDVPDFPYAPRYVTLPSGPQMHFLEEGPAKGELVLLLHGQPTWSFLYRKVIAGLVEVGHRVVAPDFVGYGRSDKPAQRTDVTVRAHLNWLYEFIEERALSDITLVVQDWGGPIGLGVLATAPDRFARVVVANTVLHTADPSLSGRLAWACHAGPDGTMAIEQSLLDYQRMTQEIKPFAPSLFVQGATESVLSDPVLAAYDAPFPDETYCAGPRQLPLLMGLTPGSACARQNRRTLTALRDFRRPLLSAFSDRDPSTKGWDRVLTEAVPGAAFQSHVVIEGAGHFLQEDKGPELAEAITRFIRATPA